MASAGVAGGANALPRADPGGVGQWLTIHTPAAVNAQARVGREVLVLPPCRGGTVVSTLVGPSSIPTQRRARRRAATASMNRRRILPTMLGGAALCREISTAAAAGVRVAVRIEGGAEVDVYARVSLRATQPQASARVRVRGGRRRGLGSFGR